MSLSVSASTLDRACRETGGGHVLALDHHACTSPRAQLLHHKHVPFLPSPCAHLLHLCHAEVRLREHMVDLLALAQQRRGDAREGGEARLVRLCQRHGRGGLSTSKGGRGGEEASEPTPTTRAQERRRRGGSEVLPSGSPACRRAIHCGTLTIDCSSRAKGRVARRRGAGSALPSPRAHEWAHVLLCVWIWGGGGWRLRGRWRGHWCRGGGARLVLAVRQ